MSTASIPTTTPTASIATTRRSAHHRNYLRAVLTANAATSAIVGAAGLAASSWVSTTLGIDSVGWTRTVSAGLILFAAAVASVARRSNRRLAQLAVVISTADITWVVATVAVLVTADLTTPGTLVAVTLGVGVADFAALQLWFAARAQRTATN